MGDGVAKLNDYAYGNQADLYYMTTNYDGSTSTLDGYFRQWWMRDPAVTHTIYDTNSVAIGISGNRFGNMNVNVRTLKSQVLLLKWTLPDN
jgi:hypothetical protein